jgi:hypothetical protein
MTNDNEKAQKWKLSKGLGLFSYHPIFFCFSFGEKGGKCVTLPRKSAGKCVLCIRER